ncbi:MAG: hypothetical protein NVS4B3_07150 [Gemmatimonadaceae bacterium]
MSRAILLLPGLCIGIALRSLAAQAPSATIDPGMTREQVIARLGAPASERKSGSRLHLFYSNGCEKTCGMHDLITLDKDKVVDAIFRGSTRTYTGKSSSPVQTNGRRSSVEATKTDRAQGREEHPRTGEPPSVVNLEVRTAPISSGDSSRRPIPTP